MPTHTMGRAATGLPNDTTRRTALASLAGLGAVVALTKAARATRASAKPDPIFAAIEKHKAAHAAFVTALGLDDGDGPDVEPTSDVEEAAREAMHETVPQTVAGLAAYVAYWNAWSDRDLMSSDSYSGEALPTIAAAMAALFPAEKIGGAA